MDRIALFITELRRRRVFRTGGLFLIGAWLLIQVAGAVTEPLGLPDWTTTFVVWAAVIGFPVALVLGWRYEIGPQGISRTTARTGETVDLTLRPSDYAILALVIAAIGIVTYGVVSPSRDPSDLSPNLTVEDGPPRVAVLPFVTEGSVAGDSDLRDVIDGFVDRLRDQLNQIQELRTGARPSSNAFRSAEPRTPRDYVSIAERLSVQFLIDGTFSRFDDNDLCATVELIEGSSGLLLPSGSHQFCESTIGGLQQLIFSSVVQQLLPDDVAAVATPEPEVTEVSAQEAMLVADSLYNKVRDNEIVDTDALNRAIALYREVVEADSDSALAHARLASALLWRGEPDEAQEYIAKAWVLDKDLPEVHTTFGDYYFLNGDEQAGSFWKRAVDLNRNNADAQNSYGLWLWLNNKITEAAEYYQRSIELDRLALIRYADYGEFLGMSGQSEETLDLADSVLELFPNVRGYRLIARLNELAGRVDHAIAWALRARELEPDNTDLGDQIAELYARIGDYAVSRRYESGPVVGLMFLRGEYAELIPAVENALDNGEVDLNSIYLLAFAYNASGRPDDAAFWFEQFGLPETALGDAYLSATRQALVHYIAAIYEEGDEETAAELADWFVQNAVNYINGGASGSWWPYAYQACALAGVRRDTEALDQLEKLPALDGLVLYPLLTDSLCFAHLQDNERYRDVVESIDDRMAEYRARLPETLEEFDLR